MGKNTTIPDAITLSQKWQSLLGDTQEAKAIVKLADKGHSRHTNKT
jgi:hypothetical protein